MVSKELDRLQSRPNSTRKRKCETTGSGSIRSGKMIKLIRDSTLQANTASQSHQPVDDDLAYPPGTIESTSPVQGGLPDPDKGSTIPAEMTTSMTHDGGWAFAETAETAPANDGGWAFAETARVMSLIDSGWAFAETNNTELMVPAETTISSMSANDSGWTLTEIAVANDAMLACSGKKTTSSANNGEGPFAAIMANGGDLAFDPAIVAMSNGEWASTT